MSRSRSASSISLALLCLALGLALGACQGMPAPAGPEDGAMSSTDGGVVDPPKECAACGAGEVCSIGKCVPLPSGCPCPKESYCNLGGNTCVAGCLDDDDCDAGRICDTGARKCKAGCRADAACGSGKICDDELCRAGCRKDGDCGGSRLCDPVQLVCKDGCTSDAACGMGQICENLRCKAGCRSDAGCGMGQICESQKCRGGCRKDEDCGMDAVCKLSGLTCVMCPADADEAMDSRVSTSGRSVSQRVTRVLCGAGDVDRVTWTQAPPNPGYYRYSTWVTVSGASASGVTTVKLDFGGGAPPKTVSVMGNGFLNINSDQYDYYCFMGMCAGWTYRYEISTTSDTPVSAELGMSVSATR